MPQQLEQHLSKYPNISLKSEQRSGKPCIRDTRIAVHDVLDYLASGMTHLEIISEFPELSCEDISSCLVFAADRERRLLAGI